MRYQDEFGRYSSGEDRAPWELTPLQVWQERRSCRKVDELGNSGAEQCRVIEQGKADHAAAQAKRAEAQATVQAKRAEAQARMQAQQAARRDAAQKAAAEAVRRSTPERPVTARPQQTAIPPVQKTPVRAAAPEGPGNSAKPKQKGKLHWILLVLAVFFVFGIADNIFNSVWEDWEEDSYIEGDNDDDFFNYYDDDITWDEAEEETYVLPGYEGDSSGLVLDLQSSSGKQALSYQELYEKCRPSMVSITVRAGQSGATGSGIILTEDGYILTCDHVIDNMERCTVLTYDDKSYEAELVGTDVQTDLAVLKIDAEGLIPAELGNSDELRVGDEALAIGDPLGENFRATLTNGIISGMNRSVSSNGYAMTLIQTTAAVNSGNSGGGLFNIYGQAVGVVNLKMVTSGDHEATVEGMGMAVPMVTAKTIVETLAKEGAVRRPVLGISCYSIDEISADLSGIPAGLMVESIDEASDCAAKGIEVYDIITAVNGVPVCTVQDFKAATADCGIGDTVILTVYRDNNLEAEQEAIDNGEDVNYEECDYQYYGEIEVMLVDSDAVN